MAAFFARIAAWAARRARWVLVVALLVAIAAGIGATRIPTDAGVGTLVDSSDPTYQATEHVRSVFGEEPVVVLVKGELPQLLLSKDIFRLLRLEGCLSGRVPKGATPLPGACTELAESGAVEFVSGPATFLNEAVVQIDRQLERLSKEVAPAELREFLLAVATKYGITSLPSIDNEQFVATVVFDLARARGTPKARLAYLFPNSHTAQIIVRLKPDLSQAERHRAIGLIEDLVAETTPRRQCAEGGRAKPCFVLSKGSYVVSGAPVVVDGLARALKDALLLLFGVALAVMAVMLVLVFRSRLRLLPLAVAVAATAIAFAVFGLANGSLTMASIAALPILIGLAVDYAIQFQARFDEASAAGAGGVEAARAAALAGAPTIAAACFATAAGFLALQLSPTPMVRGFGWLLIAGVAIAFALALTAGSAALALGSSRRGAFRSDSETRAPRPVAWLLGLALEQPAAVLGVGLALAILGWGLGTRVGTVSDIRDLAPQSLPAVHNLNELQEATGVSGELDVSIVAADLADPATVRWMAGFKRRVLRENGFTGEDPSCLRAEVCPGPALSDFLTRGGGRLTRSGIEATLAALSSYDLRQVAPLAADGKIGHSALISFGIRAQSLEDQQRLVDRVRAAIGTPGQPGGPPAGVEVHLAGLAVIAAESAGALSSSRYWLALGGLIAVALALLLVYRGDWRRALLPLVPTVLATGWASLLLWLTGIPLNPMSAALGALTIAIGTEFGVILSGRFHQERASGRSLEEALRRTYARTGAAVLASGLTAIAGFAVLVASEIQMLRDFGVVTVIDLTAALLGVLAILPAALVLLEERARRAPALAEER
ncbi:MAG: MMPL family transporter [Actinobacteria bacterium]|nr:MMPL family transporter [Actinomycetota bacterium]